MRSVRSRLFVCGLFACVPALGCHREAPPAVAVAAAEPKPEPVAPSPASNPAPATPTPAAPAPAPEQTQPPPPPAPPRVFPFADDAGGKELPKVVAPRAPAPPSVEKFGAAPKDRTPPARVVQPDALGKSAFAPPAALPPRPKGFAPHAPTERVPFDLGVGAATVPARPAFAVAKSEPVIAPDVTAPPPLATLGKQVPDRASLEDPAAEPAGAVIVNRVVSPAYERAEFFRLVLPDPFEFAAQVKPVVPPAADPGLSPVTVNPMRPR